MRDVTQYSTKEWGIIKDIPQTIFPQFSEKIYVW